MVPAATRSKSDGPRIRRIETGLEREHRQVRRRGEDLPRENGHEEQKKRNLSKPRTQTRRLRPGANLIGSPDPRFSVSLTNSLTTARVPLDSAPRRWHRVAVHWTLAHMILDLTHNSIEAGATRVEVSISQEGSRLRVAIIDNGKGMDDTTKRRALDPFYTEPGKHPGRRVGLGLPFLVQTVEQTNGTYRLESTPGFGTEVHFTVDTTHLDCPPLGSVVDLAVMLFCFDGGYELVLHRGAANGTPPAEYTVARSELQEALGDLRDMESRALLEDYLEGWESELRPD